ncbi:MAG TPA: hypothetical protein VF803_00345, partial [Candidatus Paceibacterota bacterium]
MKKNHESRIMNHELRGIATLPTIILLAVVILAIGIGTLSLGLSEGIISAGSLNSSKALSYADAGAKDALLRLARNKGYACTATNCYSLDMVQNGCTTGLGCAMVSVSANTGASGDPKIITSQGKAGSSVRTLQASV